MLPSDGLTCACDALGARAGTGEGLVGDGLLADVGVRHVAKKKLMIGSVGPVLRRKALC